MHPDAKQPPAGRQGATHEVAGRRYFGTDSTVFDAARLDAMAGQPVFPVHPLTKAPLVRNGFKDATTDVEVIEKWWQRWPDVNVAAPVPDGVFILDIDRRKGGDRTIAKLTKFFGPLPETRTVLTGDGCHLYLLRPPGELMVPRPLKGIDLRDGGKHYVVRPPSMHSSGVRYRWLGDANDAIAEPPAWLAELVRRPEVSDIGHESRPIGAVIPLPKHEDRWPSWGKVDDNSNGERPWSDVDWSAILEPAGWVLHSHRGRERHWTRPGKLPSQGCSASSGYSDADTLHVFTSGDELLVAGETYTRWGAVAALRFKGDHAAAARAWREGR